MMLLVLSLISGLLAIGCLAAGIVVLIKQSRKDTTANKTSGMVVDLQKRIFNPGSGGVYCPTIEFKTTSGETVRFESSFGTMPASHKIGESIKIRYDQNDPHKAEVDSRWTNWLYPGCLLVFAGGAFVFSVIFGMLYLITAKRG